MANWICWVGAGFAIYGRNGDPICTDPNYVNKNILFLNSLKAWKIHLNNDNCDIYLINSDNCYNMPFKSTIAKQITPKSVEFPHIKYHTAAIKML